MRGSLNGSYPHFSFRNPPDRFPPNLVIRRRSGPPRLLPFVQALAGTPQDTLALVAPPAALWQAMRSQRRSV